MKHVQWTLSISNLQAESKNLFEIEKVRDRDIKLAEVNVQGAELFVRDGEKFEIESSRDRESPL